MSVITHHQSGTPSWADIGVPDIPAAVVFYSALFGWDCQDQGPETGHYHVARIGGKAVAGIGAATSPGPPMWSTSIAVVDVDAAAAAITAAGGDLLASPFDVLPAGRKAVAMDPTGAVFAVWEARAHIGAERMNEPGAVCWFELAARDADTALAFYRQVFGWTVQTQSEPMTYHELQLDGRAIGGCMPMDASWPAELPNHWMVYFDSPDCAATAERCVELGGAVHVPPTPIPPGSFAVLADPQGGVFSIMTMNEPML